MESALSGAEDATQVSGEVRWQRPVMTQILEAYDRHNYSDNDDDGSSDASDEGQLRAMPTKAAVVAAGRYDLHHAITYWGGYKQVGGYSNIPILLSEPDTCVAQRLCNTRDNSISVTAGISVLEWSGVSARYARSGGIAAVEHARLTVGGASRTGGEAAAAREAASEQLPGVPRH